MKPLFSNTRTKRRTAYTVLLVWLFALVSGWANACLLQERGTHWHGSSEDATPTAQAPHVSPGHVGVDSDHAENAGPAKSVCLRACNNATQTIIKLASSVDLLDVAMAPPAGLIWFDSLGDAALDDAWLASPAPSSRVPLRTRFARLAL